LTIPHTTQEVDFCRLGKDLIVQETKEIIRLQEKIDESFNAACRMILSCKGKIIVLGVGKSGHIGRKIAATFSSTGSPAHFMHPTEACHGDFGMITEKDIIIAISFSGEAAEVTTLLPLIDRKKLPLIAITGNKLSNLAKAAAITLDISITQEACPLGLAPTSSTTVTLVLGDAIAVAVLKARGFTKEDFAFSHPGGRLGKKLLVKVSDVMHRNDKLPLVNTEEHLDKALIEMTRKGLGICGVIDENSNILTGVFTDGDLRRTLETKESIHDTAITKVMTTGCRTITANTLAITALSIMEQHKITVLFVTNDHKQPIGIVHLHHLISAGIV
jgi:arabinose-5-phosphate isomerase